MNVTDGKVIRLLVEDEPMDLRYGQDRRTRAGAGLPLRHAAPAHRVDLADGQERAGQLERLVSFTQRPIAAIRYEVEPIDDDMRWSLQSDLLANEPVPARRQRSPPRRRARRAADRGPRTQPRCSARCSCTTPAQSGLRVAAGMDHEVHYPAARTAAMRADEDLGPDDGRRNVPSGERLALIKYVAYGWSADGPVPALRAQVDAALAVAKQTGWDALVHEQREYLDDFWHDADVEIDGDPELQQAVRFAMFHVLQAGARGRDPGDPRQGPDRHRATTATRSGTPRRSCCRC